MSVEISWSSPVWVDSDLVRDYECPSCKEEIGISDYLSIEEVRKTRSFCPSCGEKILWGQLL